VGSPARLWQEFCFGGVTCYRSTSDLHDQVCVTPSKQAKPNPDGPSKVVTRWFQSRRSPVHRIEVAVVGTPFTREIPLPIFGLTFDGHTKNWEEGGNPHP
jgi:hypothetical protein